MSFIKKIQSKLSDRSLQKKRVDRAIVATNLKNAKSVGLVYFAGDDETLGLVKRYVKILKEMGIKVKALGFFDEKELPLDANPKLEFDFFCKKELNLRLQPECSVVDNFIEESFDILIDCSIDEIQPVKYISCLSVAKFKVGANYLNYASELDLTINIEKEEGVRGLLKNIDHFLHTINKE